MRLRLNRDLCLHREEFNRDCGLLRFWIVVLGGERGEGRSGGVQCFSPPGLFCGCESKGLLVALTSSRCYVFTLVDTLC